MNKTISIIDLIIERLKISKGAARNSVKVFIRFAEANV